MKHFLHTLLICLPLIASAQEAETKLRQGNELFRANDQQGAGERYMEAISADPKDQRASFNFGNSLYAKGDSAGFVASADRFESAAKLSATPSEQARAYHNLGNAFMQQQKYQKAVDAFKNALKRDPADEDTRYNLAYAQKMLKKQQEEQQKEQEEKNDQEQKEDKDGEGDKEKEQQQKEQEKEGDQEKQDQGQDKKEQEKKPEQKEQGEEQKPQGMSKEDAERMLDALNYQEQQIQGKVLEEQQPTNRITIEKDW